MSVPGDFDVMNKRILVADDDNSVRESLKKVLENAGYDVICVANGDDAEKQISIETIDLLILDLNLPGQDGWNVFGLASALKPLLPVIILTGLKEQSENAFLAGVAAFLEKPVDVLVLLNTVARLLAEPAQLRLLRATVCARQRPIKILA